MKRFYLVFLVACPFMLSVCATGTAGTTTSNATSNTISNTVSYDSATMQSVTRITDDGLSKDWVAVSPDGGKILYCESERPLRWNDISNETTYPAYSFKIVLLKDASKPTKTLLINDVAHAPAWSEDNTIFVYVVFEGNSSKLIRSNITRAGKTYITRNAIGKWDTRPSIKNHVILCDTEIDGRRQIVSLNDNGTEVTMQGEGYSPRWHPSGEKYIFIRNGNIFEMDMKTNQATELYSDTEFVCLTPSYSPDGKHILFQKESVVSSTSTNKEIIRWHLFAVRSDGTSLTQLTSGNADVYSPSWGVDNTVFFISNAGGQSEIWRAKITLD